MKHRGIHFHNLQRPLHRVVYAADGARPRLAWVNVVLHGDQDTCAPQTEMFSMAN